MNPYRRRAAYLLPVLPLLLVSCSSNSGAPTNQHDPGGEQDINNVIYVGEVTDEALVRLLDVPAKTDARRAVIIASPDLDTPLPKGSRATWQFHLASEAKRGPLPRVWPARHRSPEWQRSLHQFLQLLAPERIAHAHDAPYNGTAFYLVITDADSNQKLQVFTTETSFTPSAVDWNNLVQAPQPLTLQITSAFFEENDVPADGGPFVGGTFPFRIE